MGLFSDDIDYRDLDALCIKVKRMVGDGVIIEIPLHVDARISYVTSYNAKDIILEGSSVKDLKKSGKLLYAFKPIFEKYLTEEVNAHPEYAESIFPDDFFGEPKLEYNEKHAKELIDSQLFKEALTKINDPEGFDEVKFEKIYGIAPVVFKIRSIESGLSMPYDYSELVKTEVSLDEEEVSSLEPITVEDKVTSSESDVNIIPENKSEEDPEIEEIRRLKQEELELEAKCAQKQSEIQSAKESLEKTLGSVASLENQLKEREAFVAQYNKLKEALSRYGREILEGKEKLYNLNIVCKEKQTQLNELKSRVIDSDSNLLYSILRHK